MTNYVESSSSNVPAFLSKLWILVEEETTDELICWDASGKSFHVYDQGRFAKEILPLYFKHNNIASFIRQLNMYGFRKVTHVEQGGLKVEKDDMEFAHQYFVRGQEQMLEHIKRKISTGKGDDVKIKPDDVHRVLSDVRSMKGKQDNLSSKLDSMKRENEVLWREVATLRQKHHKQQQIVNKLIQFLVTMVSNQRGLAMKRKMPLMINDVSQLHPSSKIQKLNSFENTSPDYSTNDQQGQGVTIYEVVDAASPQNLVNTTSPPPGAQNVATDLSAANEQAELTLDSILEADNDLAQQPFINASQFTSSPPGDSVMTQPTMQNAQTSQGQAAPSAGTVSLSRWVKPSTSGISQPSLAAGQLQSAASLPSPKIDEVSDHLDGLQSDLDVLKDMLSTSNYSLDTSTIFGLFNPEGPVPQTPDYSTLFGTENPLTLAGAGNGDDSLQTEGQGIGGELVSYDPNNDTYSSLFELQDPLLDDNAMGLLSDDPIGLAGSTLNTPDVTPLTVSSSLASKRKKKVPGRAVAKTESID